MNALETIIKINQFVAKTVLFFITFVFRIFLNNYARYK